MRNKLVLSKKMLVGLGVSCFIMIGSSGCTGAITGHKYTMKDAKVIYKVAKG